MPPALISAYAEMLPRLEAEEDLRLIANIAAGNGLLKRHAADEHRRELLKRANVGVPTRKASLSDVESMGIRVRKVPRG
jgi:hypothetical protein